jgi:putative transposase
MPRRRILDPFGLHFLTLTIVGWIDLFSNPSYKNIIIQNLRFCQEQKGLIVYAYVIMSNHLHLIVRVKESNQQGLGDVIRDFKKFTAKSIWKTIHDYPESRRDWLSFVLKYYGKYHSTNKGFQIWIHGNHPVLLFSEKVIWQKIHYIHENPVRQGIVEYPSDYLFSSARNYMEIPNRPLEVTLIDPPML